MKTFSKLFVTSLILTICACSTKTLNLVRRPIDAQSAIVSINEGEFSPGERVTLLKRHCIEVQKKEFSSTKCTMAPVGEASIVELKPNHEALIRADGGIALEKGMLVEKLTR